MGGTSYEEKKGKKGQSSKNVLVYLKRKLKSLKSSLNSAREWEVMKNNPSFGNGEEDAT